LRRAINKLKVESGKWKVTQGGAHDA